jgi:transcriptional regulator with XRE-family HTH domain
MCKVRSNAKFLRQDNGNKMQGRDKSGMIKVILTTKKWKLFGERVYMEIGSTIRTIRQKKGITMGQLCEGTGLSQGFLSLLENNKTTPSLNTLESIANYLKVPLPYFLLKSNERMNVVKKDERTYSLFRGKHKIENLGGIGGLRVQLTEIQPNAEEEVWSQHEGMESHFVVKGNLLAIHGDDQYIVEEGDTFSWHASVPHRVENMGDETAVLLIVTYSDNYILHKNE